MRCHYYQYLWILCRERGMCCLSFQRSIKWVIWLLLPSQKKPLIVSILMLVNFCLLMHVQIMLCKSAAKCCAWLCANAAIKGALKSCFVLKKSSGHKWIVRLINVSLKPLSLCVLWLLLCSLSIYIFFPNTDDVVNGIVKIIHVKYLSRESFSYVKGKVRRVWRVQMVTNEEQISARASSLFILWFCFFIKYTLYI